MTVLVGVLCRDGVVIGADSSATLATAQFRTVEQETKKIDIVDNQVIVAGTGQIGLGQRFVNIIEKARKGNLFNHVESHIEIGVALSRAGIDDFSSTKATQESYGALVAFPFKEKPYLCEFALKDFQPEFKNDRLWYVSMGSGQYIADPFLGLIREAFWATGPPSLQDGIFAVVWTLHHTIAVNPGGIKGPQQIAILRYEEGKLRANMLEEDDLGEHQQNVQGVYAHLREYAVKLRKKDKAPDVPKPPS